MTPDDEITPPKPMMSVRVDTDGSRGSVLKGSRSDFLLATELYKQDREIEALTVIDQILEMPEDVEACVARMRRLMTEPDIVAFRTEQHSPTAFEIHVDLGGGSVPAILALRCKCFSTLLAGTDPASDESLRCRGLMNSELVLRLFPDDPDFITFASQVLFLTGDKSRAVALLRRAVTIVPESRLARTCLQMFEKQAGEPDVVGLTSHAVEIVLEEMAKSRPDPIKIDEADAAIGRILEVTDGQAEAWAARAWVAWVRGRAEDAAFSLRKALQLDPVNPFVRRVAEVLAATGIRGSIPVQTPRSSWPTAGGNAARHAPVAGPLKPPLRVAWTFDPHARIQGGIVCEGNTIAFGDGEGVVHGLDARTGRKRWEYAMPGIHGGTPAIDKNHLFVGGTGGFACLDLNSGAELWRVERETSGPQLFASSCCVLVLDDRLFICDDRLTILSVADGREVGALDVPMDLRGPTGACADERYIYIPLNRRILRVSRDSLQTEGVINTDGKVSAGPSIVGSLLLYGSTRTKLVAVELPSLEPAWTFEIEEKPIYEFAGAAVESRPAAAGDRLVFGGPDGNIYAVGLRNGQRLWKVPTGHTISSPPIVIGGFAYLLLGSGTFAAVSVADGSIVWRYDAQKTIGGATCDPALAYDKILTGWDRLYAFASASPSG